MNCYTSITYSAMKGSRGSLDFTSVTIFQLNTLPFYNYEIIGQKIFVST